VGALSAVTSEPELLRDYYILPTGGIALIPEVESFLVPCSWLLDDVCSHPACVTKTYVLILAGTCAAQQFSTNCTDVKVDENETNPYTVDTACVVTMNGAVTYQHSTLYGGQSTFATISAAEAQKLRDYKTAWLTRKAAHVLAWNTFQACSEAANHKPRKERKQARLDCKSALDSE
jgi:hypothetical protein